MCKPGLKPAIRCNVFLTRHISLGKVLCQCCRVHLLSSLPAPTAQLLWRSTRLTESILCNKQIWEHPALWRYWSTLPIKKYVWHNLQQDRIYFSHHAKESSENKNEKHILEEGKKKPTTNASKRRKFSIADIIANWLTRNSVKYNMPPPLPFLHTPCIFVKEPSSKNRGRGINQREHGENKNGLKIVLIFMEDQQCLLWENGLLSYRKPRMSFNYDK